MVVHVFTTLNDINVKKEVCEPTIENTFTGLRLKLIRVTSPNKLLWVLNLLCQNKLLTSVDKTFAYRGN